MPQSSQAPQASRPTEWPLRGRIWLWSRSRTHGPRPRALRKLGYPLADTGPSPPPRAVFKFLGPPVALSLVGPGLFFHRSIQIEKPRFYPKPPRKQTWRRSGEQHLASCRSLAGLVALRAHRQTARTLQAAGRRPTAADPKSTARGPGGPGLGAQAQPRRRLAAQKLLPL
jgi:hypothetical protein